MHSPAVALAAFILGAACRPPTLGDAAIPDDLHLGVAGKGARQQLESGEMAAPHDDQFSVSHSGLVSFRAPHRLGSVPILVEDGPQRLVEVLPAAKE